MQPDPDKKFFSPEDYQAAVRFGGPKPINHRQELLNEVCDGCQFAEWDKTKTPKQFSRCTEDNTIMININNKTCFIKRTPAKDENETS